MYLHVYPEELSSIVKPVVSFSYNSIQNAYGQVPEVCEEGQGPLLGELLRVAGTKSRHQKRKPFLGYRSTELKLKAQLRHQTPAAIVIQKHWRGRMGR